MIIFFGVLASSLIIGIAVAVILEMIILVFIILAAGACLAYVLSIFTYAFAVYLEEKIRIRIAISGCCKELVELNSHNVNKTF